MDNRFEFIGYFPEEDMAAYRTPRGYKYGWFAEVHINFQYPDETTVVISEAKAGGGSIFALPVRDMRYVMEGVDKLLSFPVDELREGRVDLYSTTVGV